MRFALISLIILAANAYSANGAVLVGQGQSGNFKVCKYNDGSVTTVASHELCPLTN